MDSFLQFVSLKLVAETVLMPDLRWYAIQTTAGHENKVRSLIARRITEDAGPRRRADSVRPCPHAGSCGDQERQGR